MARNFGKISYKDYTKNTKELTKANIIAIKNHPKNHPDVWIDDAKGGKQYYAPISPKYKDQFTEIVIARAQNRNINGRILTKAERRAAIPWQRGRQIYSGDQYFFAKSQREFKKANNDWYNKRHKMTAEDRKKR